MLNWCTFYLFSQDFRLQVVGIETLTIADHTWNLPYKPKIREDLETGLGCGGLYTRIKVATASFCPRKAW